MYLLLKNSKKISRIKTNIKKRSKKTQHRKATKLIRFNPKKYLLNLDNGPFQTLTQAPIVDQMTTA